MSENATIIFTDGASRGNPGPGGWGAVIYKKSNIKNQTEEHITELGGGERDTTNNRMELTAVIEALRYIKEYCTICHTPTSHTIIYTDSKYLISGITKWVHNWQRNNWQTKAKQAVLNQDLWQELVELSRDLEIDWQYVSGHSGIIGNERADEIATASADQRPIELYSGPADKYPHPLFDQDFQVGRVASAKSSASAVRSSSARGKPYSYVSLVDGQVQTHSSWSECQARVHGVKDAKFKKVFSRQEERALIEEWTGY